MTNKKNISHKKKSFIERLKLKDYLRDNLSETLAKKLEDAESDDFLKDAMDGLESFSSTNKIDKSVAQLHKTLHQSIDDKRKSKPLRFAQIAWYVLAVVIIILLVSLAFAVIRMRG
ncbi:hypothetical protein A9P82_02730 [Arachidicoccus ginsenosidimutans]|uniref:hypothetical protein n=1 Tax=Arachidicoccus sp. BS20 TaxID=1850526 RepID=UPI0007F0CACC|nr:hypothetical protein [Arachidicoccus sp. BS20]ANI88315.1 hypothetical protein A9P82_02730 [Arachidicoccus sp. BS20]